MPDYSDEQYIVMLPWCTLEGYVQGNKPDQRQLYERDKLCKSRNKSRKREVTADYDLPVRIQRKAGWKMILFEVTGHRVNSNLFDKYLGRRYNVTKRNSGCGSIRAGDKSERDT